MIAELGFGFWVGLVAKHYDQTHGAKDCTVHSPEVPIAPTFMSNLIECARSATGLRTTNTY